MKALYLLVLAASVSCQQYDLSGIHVQGNQFVNSQNEPVILRGLNFGGAAYACTRDKIRKTFLGPSDHSILLEAYRAWNANAIRLPLNEHCWLGINGEDSSYFGSGYRSDVMALTNLFTNAGMVVIIDLHWASPGVIATHHAPMPNTANSVDYWTSVAQTFRDNDKVIFELYNEPYPDYRAFDSEEGWRCLREGGMCEGVDYDGVKYEAASMQSLVDAVRNANAPNIILLPGLRFTNSLAQWLENRPTDERKNMGAAWHSYCKGYCNNHDCWEATVGEVKKQFPIVTTEFGEEDCAGIYVTPLMKWMDEKQISYLAWTFNDWDCHDGPALIKDYENGGTPTDYGIRVKHHYTSVANL